MYAGRDRRAGPDRRSLPRDAASLYAAALRRRRPTSSRVTTSSRSRAFRLGSTQAPGCPFRSALRQRRGTLRRRASRLRTLGEIARGRLPLRDLAGARAVPAHRARRPLLEVEGLVVRYPVPRGISGVLLRVRTRFVHAVSGVSFSVDRGELVALVGESGCGKTTTAQAVLRLVRPEPGACASTASTSRRSGITICGSSAAGCRSSTRIRTSRSIPASACRATVAEPLLVHKIGSRGERRGPSTMRSSRSGSRRQSSSASRYPHELSGGQSQRVALAASLALEPELLVADEPVSMLDVSVRAGILGSSTSCAISGLAVLMITHDLSTAARFADRICVMYLGRIVEEGPGAGRHRIPAAPVHEGTPLGRSAPGSPQARDCSDSYAARRRTRSMCRPVAASIRGARSRSRRARRASPSWKQLREGPTIEPPVFSLTSRQAPGAARKRSRYCSRRGMVRSKRRSTWPMPSGPSSDAMTSMTTWYRADVERKLRCASVVADASGHSIE